MSDLDALKPWDATDAEVFEQQDRLAEEAAEIDARMSREHQFRTWLREQLVDDHFFHCTLSLAKYPDLDLTGLDGPAYLRDFVRIEGWPHVLRLIAACMEDETFQASQTDPRRS